MKKKKFLLYGVSVLLAGGFVVGGSVPPVVIAESSVHVDTGNSLLVENTVTASTVVEEGVYNDVLYYAQYTDHVRITSCDKSYIGEIVIPETINDVPVTEIDSTHYYGVFENAYLKSVTIPSSVEIINESTFYHCKNLKKVTINGAKAIMNSAFCGCDLLSEVVLPENLELIGNNAFSGCSSLNKIILPASIESISNNAFNGCSSLNEVILPVSTESIGSGAFYSCKLDRLVVKNPDCIFPSAKDVVDSSCTIYGYPNSTAEKYATDYGYKFADINLLADEIDMPTQTTTYTPETTTTTIVTTTVESATTTNETDAYVDLLKYTKYTDYIAITGLNNKNYGGKFTIPETINGLPVKVINDNAFRKCSFSEIILPESIEKIGKRVFKDCSLLKKIVLNSSVESISIEENAFQGCSLLNEIVFPASVESISIGENAFQGCGSLNEVVLPTSVESISIGGNAFQGCSSLNEVVLPTSVKSIGKQAFYNCNLRRLVVINPSCEFYSDWDIIDKTCTIYGYPNSTAETYAGKYGYIFSDIKFLADEIDIGTDVTAYTPETTTTTTTTTVAETEFAYGDINKDGKIDATDASDILSYYAYMSTKGSGTLEEYLSK